MLYRIFLKGDGGAVHEELVEADDLRAAEETVADYGYPIAKIVALGVVEDSESDEEDDWEEGENPEDENPSDSENPEDENPDESDEED